MKSLIKKYQRALFVFLVFCLAVVMLSGCASFSVETAQPDGTLCKASYTSAFKAFDTATGQACGATGGADNSRGDTELANALTGALIRGLSAGQ